MASVNFSKFDFFETELFDLICSIIGVRYWPLYERNVTAGIYLFKVKNRDTRTMCEISSNLTIKTPQQRHSGVFIVNFEHILHIVSVFPSVTLCSSVSIVNFEHIIAGWVMLS